MNIRVNLVTLRDLKSNILLMYSRILHSHQFLHIKYVYAQVFQDKPILTSFMNIRVNILIVYSRILLDQKPSLIITVLCYKLDYGDPIRLGHHQGLREQHPDGVQQDSTLSPTFTYYMFYAQFFKTNRYKLFSRRSKSTRSPSGTLRPTS